ncbi:MAG: choline/ethanolamine kinase family protein [Smithellaceae bacterium]|nr:choline/ethanolamine kinase family protein [Smithellaceae bacterium]
MYATRRLLDRDFTQDVCYELLPAWKGLDVRITQLNGGITNKLYRIQSEKGDYTVRIYGDKTDLFINRDHEAETIREMAKIGVSSALVKYLPEMGATIVEYIDNSIVLTNKDFLDRSLYGKIVAPIKKIHHSGVKLKKIFNPMVEVKKMASILEGIGVKDGEFEIDKTIARLHKLSSIINIPETDYLACHNDLLADNFILINEGFEHLYAAPMYIIDWEYAGMSTQYYDLADMFQEILIPREAEKLIIREYCEGKDFDKTLYQVDLSKPFPDIYWFLWSLIQLNVSTIKFDYYSYGKTKYENAQQNIEFIQREYGLSV